MMHQLSRQATIGQSLLASLYPDADPDCDHDPVCDPDPDCDHDCDHDRDHDRDRDRFSALLVPPLLRARNAVACRAGGSARV